MHGQFGLALPGESEQPQYGAIQLFSLFFFPFVQRFRVLIPPAVRTILHQQNVQCIIVLILYGETIYISLHKGLVNLRKQNHGQHSIHYRLHT